MDTPENAPPPTTESTPAPEGNGIVATAPPAIAPTTALRCDCCGRRPMLIPEISVGLKSTMGPVAMDETKQMFRIPILCDECLAAFILLVRRAQGIIQPETDLTTFKRIEIPGSARTA